MTVGVVVEEHPELDNPLGKAQGAVQACETYLAEAHEVAERLAGKVARAEAGVVAASEQHAAAVDEIATCTANLDAARAALAAIEGA